MSNKAINEFLDEQLDAMDAFETEGEAAREAFQRSNDQYHQLIHRVFAQTDAGVQLLEFLKESVLMTPSIQPQYTQYESALIEGRKELVREFINAINSVEKNT